MTVIYLFVSPSGRAYAGRHTCQHEGWPRRGSGALPSGYRGSGKLWANVTRRHGPAIRWIILRRFGPDAARADIDAAERRAIRLVRHLWAGRCVNLLSGGEGLTSTDAVARWADPALRAKMSAALKDANARPEVKAKISAAHNRPEVKAKLSAARKEQWQDPAARAKVSAASKAMWSDPDLRARLSATHTARWSNPDYRAKTTAAQRKALDRPEVKAKADAARKEAMNRPEVLARNSAAQTEAQNRPEVKALKSAASKAMWSDPDHAAKVRAGRLRNFIRAANARNKARRVMEEQQ